MVNVLGLAKSIGGGVVNAVKGAYSGIKNKGKTPGVTYVSGLDDGTNKTKKAGSSIVQTVATAAGIAGVSGVVGSLLGGSESTLKNDSQNENPVRVDYTNYQETVNYSSSDINVYGDGNTITGGVAESISKPSSSLPYSAETSQGTMGTSSEGLGSLLGNIDTRTLGVVGLGIGAVYLFGKYLGKPSYKTYSRRYY